MCMYVHTYVCRYICIRKLFKLIRTYLVPANKLPLPLPSVEAATDNEITTTPALPIVLKPNGYNIYTKYIMNIL